MHDPDHFFFFFKWTNTIFLGILSNTHHVLLLQPLSTYNVIKELPIKLSFYVVK
jgi:hypothetical protein